MAGAMDLDHCVHQSLKELHLQGGSFVMDAFAAKLTYLEVNNAEVHSAAECIHCRGLLCLCVHDGAVKNLNLFDFPACTALRSIHLGCDEKGAWDESRMRDVCLVGNRLKEICLVAGG